MALRNLYLIVFLATSVGLVAQTVSPPLFDAFEYDDDGDGIVDEFDDFPADATFSFETHEPTRSQAGRLAFEVDWPLRGDDDFNDLVLAYHFVQVTNSTNEVVEFVVDVTVVAIGTDTPVGCAIRLPIPAGTVVKATLARDGGVPASVSPEAGTTEMIYRLFDNALTTRDADPFTNTLVGEPWVHGEQFELRATLATGVPIPKLAAEPFDLFAFHTDEPGREIHRPNALPSQLADVDLFGTFSDRSAPNKGPTYLSDTGLPWAIEIPETWSHPTEGTDLARAYPRIVDWIESGGSAEFEWYRHPEPNEVLP